MVEQFLIDGVKEHYPSHRVYAQNGMITEVAGTVKQQVTVVTPDKRSITVNCLVNESSCAIVGFSIDQHNQLNG